MNINERTKNLVETLLIESNKIKEEDIPLTNEVFFLDKYGFDSIFMMRLIVAIEQEINIEVDLDELNMENFRSVTTIADFLHRALSN